jgi:hypothetical protein
VIARRLLFLDALGLTAYRRQGGVLHAEENFIADDAGLKTFAEYLKRHNTSLFYLLADVADEGFQIEDLPHVHGGNRAEMLKRKLSQYFHSTPLVLAKSLGRAKSGRRDEKFLLAGLTGYSQFEPWLQALRRADAQLAGIYSTPFILPMLAGKLMGRTEPLLFMTITRAGLRQTFLAGGQLRFSRLTPLATDSIDDIALTCSTESRKIYQYLAGHRMIACAEPLATLILAHPDHFNIIGEHCGSTPEQTIRLLDLTAESARHGLKKVPPDSRADALLLHLLATRAPAEQFAPPVERRHFRLWQIRLGLNWSAGLILAGSLFYAGFALKNHMALTTANNLLQSEVALSQHRYDAMLQSLPPISVSHDELRALTDRYRALASRSPGPEPMLQHISRALDQSPTVDLDKIDWWIANTSDETRGLSMDAGQSAGGDAYGIALIRGRLPLALANDHKSQIDTVNGFVDMLRTPGIRVQVITLPFETKSGQAIRSTDAGDPLDPSGFVLKMVQKL